MAGVSQNEKACSLLVSYDKGEPVNVSQLKEQLETGSEDVKIEALKRAICLMVGGENLSQLLMTIIRYVIPLKNKQIKKLLLIYLEIIDKTSADGKLLPEMILICNAIRNDLIHPNEYVRGCALRFMCRLKDAELLEPLLPTVRNNLEHRHSYVRRNAILALWSVYKNHEALVPDAVEVIFDFLQKESDASCKRNAFMMLCSISQEKSVEYLASVSEQLPSMPDIMQNVAIDLIRKITRTNPTEKSKYVRTVIPLLSSTNPAVQFEAAGALLSLSHAPAAVRAATTTYISLLCTHSDNNVKLIVLDRLVLVKNQHPKIMQELLMDMLRALAAPSMDIRKKTLDIALELVTPRSIDEVITTLKKEITKTQAKEFENGSAYRQVLLHAIHSCAVRFPDIASNVVLTLMEYLGDANAHSASDVISFVREVIEQNPNNCRGEILAKLTQSLASIRAARVFRAALWILGQYATESAQVDQAFTAIKDVLGEPPFTPATAEDGTPATPSPSDAKKTPSTPTPAPAAPRRSQLLLPDGSYATQSAVAELAAIQQKEGTAAASDGKPLRSLLLGGDFFLGTALASTLVKLVLRARQLGGISAAVKNQLAAESLLIIVSLLRYGNSTHSPHHIDADSSDKLYTCVRVLTAPEDGPLREIFLNKCHESFARLLREQRARADEEKQAAKKQARADVSNVQPDQLLKIRQLTPSAPEEADELGGSDASSELSRATGQSEKAGDVPEKLDRVYQLTGFSDPLYAEAKVTTHQFDINLEITVQNQTGDTLQNVALELATLGDLKLLERPQTYTFAPYDRKVIRANIKVSSTENGIIFGNLVYDLANQTAQDKNCVILSDIHIDIMDYLHPGHVSESEFRNMWAEFEWENKVSVSTNITDTVAFLQHVMKTTNMANLTPAAMVVDESDNSFLSANLYAKSVFGEDALANVSIEKHPDGKISGFIRIRSKTQGIALSIGDKINMKQKQ